MVEATTLAGPQRIAYDQLVFAFGTRANLALVPGMAEHALPLKLVGDALFIRNRVLQRIARIELESDPALRRRLGHFVVIGGGFSGVEVAGQLADFVRGARRYYPRVGADELRVTPAAGRAAAAARTARIARPLGRRVAALRAASTCAWGRALRASAPTAWCSTAARRWPRPP